MHTSPPSAAPSVHHIGVAVRSIDEAMRFYGDQFGLQFVDRMDLPEHGLEVAFVQAGNTLIELLQPTQADNTVARFIERRGEGLHHLCFESTDIRQHLRDLAEKGVQLIDAEPRPGAHGEVAFLHPGDAFGVLVELIQPPRRPRRRRKRVSDTGAPPDLREPDAVGPSDPALGGV